MRVRRSIIGGILACCLVASDQSVARADAPATQVPAPPAASRFADEIRTFEAWDSQNSPPREAVLFVGSSSIRMWNTADSFPAMPVINRGFGGSVISDATYYAPRIVVKYQPRVIVFYAGDNDIAAGLSPRQVFDDFRAFVAAAVDEPFEVTFCPAEAMPAAPSSEREILSEPEIEPLRDGRIEVGRVVFETLAAALDPYPRRADAAFEWTDPRDAGGAEKASPFAVLRSLKRDT